MRSFGLTIGYMLFFLKKIGGFGSCNDKGVDYHTAAAAKRHDFDSIINLRMS